MNPFGPGFPEPLQAVVNHAERFSAALGLSEADHRRLVAAARTEDLAATWIIGRAAEVETFVEDVVYEWRAGVLSAKRAAAAIESYLRSVHRDMDDVSTFGRPTCCAREGEYATADFLASHAHPYPCVAVCRTAPLPRISTVHRGCEPLRRRSRPSRRRLASSRRPRCRSASLNPPVTSEDLAKGELRMIQGTLSDRLEDDPQFLELAHRAAKSG